jgi:hypothetical protein
MYGCKKRKSAPYLGSKIFKNGSEINWSTPSNSFSILSNLKKPGNMAH